MDYIQFLTIMATAIAGFGFLHKEFRSEERAIREEMKAQAARTDALYTMFIDLLKTRRQK